MELSLIDNSEHIADIQRKLTILDLYHGPRCESLADLRPALRKFQQQYRAAPGQAPLPVSGECDAATWHALNQRAGTLFSEVFQYELDGLRTQNGSAPAGPPGLRPARKREVIARAHQAQLCGLALSGGGVRSATFNLGILQAMAQMKLLRHVDYLSTVSGGGFIGAWLSKWIMEEGGDVTRVEQALTPGSREEPKKHEANEIKFLRQFSNYLNPRTSLFSADSWALIASYLRNTVLNMGLIVAMLSALLCLPGLLSWLVGNYQHHDGWLAITLVSLAIAIFFSAFSISLQPNPHWRHWLTAQRQANVIVLIVLPLMVAGLCGSIALWEWRCDLAGVCPNIDATGALPAFQPRPVAATGMLEQVQQFLQAPHLPNILLPGVLFFMVWVLGWLAAQIINPALPAKEHFNRRWKTLLQECLGHLLGAMAALALGSVCIVYAVRAFAAWNAGERYGAPVIHLVTFGMPVLLLIAGLSMIVLVGLLGRLYSDRSREWWSRQGGWTTILIILWVALFATSLYAPPLLAWIHLHSRGWGNALIASGWIGTTLAGLAVGRRATASNAETNPKLQLLALAAPYVFCAGIMASVATLVHFAINPEHLAAPNAPDNTSLGQFFADYLAYREYAEFLPQIALLLGCLTLGLILAWRLDINKFSLYMIMRSRLVRTFLGASNRKRAPHPFTGFDPSDDPPLARLRRPDGLQRPYPLINTTLNLVGGKELAWQTRKAGGFVFSPGFCGFELPRTAATSEMEAQLDAARGCYRPTMSYGGRGARSSDEDQGTRLGMATAISGATISAQAGEPPSMALNFLMTLFNLRLGRWCGNPLRQRWQTTGPGIGLFCLFSELLGMTDGRANYVHLSDGGHFENLGIYELVRRRCQLIVAVDASADGALNFADLGNAIRKCYIDLGIEIDIDVSNIDVNKDGFSSEHCVAGKILYGKADADAPDGTLLYIKPSLSGKELADVLTHRKADPDFPHQTRFGQWFDETRFESYRALGYRIGCAALSEAASQARQSLATCAQQSATANEQLPIPSFCASLLRQWERPLKPL